MVMYFVKLVSILGRSNMNYPTEIYDIEDSPEIEALWDDFNLMNQGINPCGDCGVECEIGYDYCQKCSDKFDLKISEVK